MIARRLTDHRFCFALAACAVIASHWAVPAVHAQQTLAPKQVGLEAVDQQQPSEANKKPARKDPSTEEQTQFAPGIVTVIPPAPDPEETVDGPQTLQELLDTHPEIKLGGDSHPGGEPHFDPRSRTLIDMAKQVFFRREIYCLEFSFKPLRHIYIDVPGPDGRMQRKLIWYIVYRVRYRGGDLRPAVDKVAGAEVPKRVEVGALRSQIFLSHAEAD